MKGSGMAKIVLVTDRNDGKIPTLYHTIQTFKDPKKKKKKKKKMEKIVYPFPTMFCNLSRIFFLWGTFNSLPYNPKF